MKIIQFIIVISLISPLTTFSQSKRDLEEKVSKQQKTIDSLKAVIANMENIIENRDRSVKIVRADMEKYKEKIREKNTILARQESQISKMKHQQDMGTAKIMTLSNARSTLKVKEGHIWTINQFMSDYAAGFTTDSLGVKHPTEVHVFLKAINDDVLTDVANNKFGPKVYSSLHAEQVIQFPIVLTANTSFTIAVYKGSYENLSPYNGEVHISFTEKKL